MRNAAPEERDRLDEELTSEAHYLMRMEHAQITERLVAQNQLKNAWFEERRDNPILAARVEPSSRHSAGRPELGPAGQSRHVRGRADLPQPAGEPYRQPVLDGGGGHSLRLGAVCPGWTDPNHPPVRLEENEVRQHLHRADYFQIDCSWHRTYHSQSLGNRAFPLDKEFRVGLPVFESNPDDLKLAPDTVVRRVALKAPYGQAGIWPGRGPYNRWILVQCGSRKDKLAAILKGFQDDRDKAMSEVAGGNESTLAILRRRLLAVSLLSFGSVVVGVYFLVRLGLMPLKRLGHAVSKVSERDFRLQFPDKHLPSELAPIVERLKETLDQLGQTFDREKQAAADISHELRTPVAALLTTLEVALKKPRKPEEYREVLNECRESGKQISQLVERLLTLARIDSGVDRLRVEPVDVSALAEQCAALIRPLAEARGLTLRLYSDGEAMLMADPSKLREVLTNLLHNAVEYNRPDGLIELTVIRHNGTLRVEVSDTGIGIPPEARTHIFERFYRADPSRQADGLHAGLGLAIVKGYIDLMGGTISVDSVVGQGSTFRVELPAA